MFTPVEGAALEAYDAETRDMFRKRESDPRFTQTLMMMTRRARNTLPVVASPDHPWN